MANIKLGPNITDISGSIKEVIYTPWKRSQYAIKSRAGIYQNPQSIHQSRVRKLIQMASFVWRNDLTPGQRTNWNEYASGLKPHQPYPGSIRRLIPTCKNIMSGYNAFTKHYLQVQYVGITLPANFYDSPLGQTPPSGITGLGAVFNPAFTPNYALDFDGVNETVVCGDVLDYEYNQPQSWEFWMRPTVLDHQPYIIAKLTPVAPTGYSIYWHDGDLFWELVRGFTGEALRVYKVRAPFIDWRHFVCTYDGRNDAGGMKIYENGVVGGIVDFNVPITAPIVSGADLTIASKTDLPGTYFNGRMACIRNFNRNLRSSEVLTLFNGGAGLYGGDPLGDASCQAAWMFCTGSGNTLFDISGNNYHGVLGHMEPEDWVPGKVPCPTIPAHISLDWTDPAVVIPDSRVRIWIKTHELGVHRQIAWPQTIGPEAVNIYSCNMSQGAHHPITDFPGHYMLQADVIQPNGLKSPPSRTVEVVVL